MKTFEQCCEYLGISEELPKCQIRERQHQAAYKLSVCMAAWNKYDGFEPDETTAYFQFNVGYTPHFNYKDRVLTLSGVAILGLSSGIFSASVPNAASNTFAHFGLRLPLKTRERATEFGLTFIETFNELL